MIDFNEPRFEIAINHDIKAKDLKAHGVIVVVGLARSVDVRHVWLAND